MGGKNSVTKHELESPNIVATSRGHQYEEINDVLLVTHQKMDKQMTKSSSVDSASAAASIDDLVSELKSRSKILPDVVVASAAESATPTTYCPKVSHRYHPYDEINDEQLSCSQKCDNENKTKMKDGLKNKAAKKKNKAKENESTYPEISNAALKLDTLPDSSEHTDRYHPYDEITEDMLGSKNAKKVDKENISKFKKNIKDKVDKKKQNELSSVDESLSLEATSKLNISSSNLKAAPRGHTYEEICCEQLVSNRENKNADKHEKPNKSKEPKNKVGKKQQKTVSESNIENQVVSNENQVVSNENQVVSNGRFLLNTENLHTRYHPYDEISQEELDTIRRVTEDKEGNLQKQKSEEKESRTQEASNFSETEYLNVADVKATLVHSHVGENCIGQEYEDKHDCLEDMYAVPQKKKLKDKQVKELNYVEVEFNATVPKVDVKSPYSPTSYTNVVSKDGRIVILDS